MKRSPLVFSIIAASVLGCFAFSSTASEIPHEGVSSCTMLYDYCLATGQQQSYCWQQYLECCDSGGACQYGVVASERPAVE
ncbi:MAG TPA: hypothetical protein VIM92_10115 [Rhodanobacteraceae bacterium]